METPVSAPQTIPSSLVDAFTLAGRVPVEEWYFDQSTPPAEGLYFSAAAVAAYRDRARCREAQYYGETDDWLFTALDNFPIAGKHCAILGSREPWYESICLEFGASTVTTVEYAPIHLETPGLRAMTPEQFERTPEVFDCALSISSVEHSGLGRYGDVLDPDGDLRAMEMLRRMVVPGGELFLAVPLGRDKLVWNAHRVYGRLRLPLLLRGWQCAASFGYFDWELDADRGRSGNYQPIFVLR